MNIAAVIASLETVPRKRQVIGACLALAMTALIIQPTSAGTLSSVSPSGAMPGITLTILGTGFHVTAANDVVTFTPATGAPLTAPAKTVATVDASTGLRRITVVVPDGLPVGRVALRVTNTATGEISQGGSFELISLTVSGTTTGAPGSSGLQVAVQASSNAVFVPGSTKVGFGAGMTLTALTIDSATLLHATLSIASTAALGPRALTVSTSTQTLGLLNAFTVATAPVNRAPTVSAGANPTITLPASASLNGSVTDDGLPTGAAVTSVWTKLSGPGSVGFANPASAVTTATFSQAGTYVLRLTASDTLLSASSDATVTVNPAIVTPPTNLAPVVIAGTAQTITLPASASLNGSVTDDGLPTGAAVTSVWTKLSGPGSVGFANPASAVTTATFSQAGTYVLRLTASDTLLSASSDATVTVNPAIVTPPTNLAPVVIAGTAQTITLPAGAPLNGSVTDDGLPTGAVVTAAWTKFSGPGAVAFANAASAVTTATFGQAGTYVLRLTASDTLLTALSDVTITVNPAVVTPPTNLAPVVSAGTAQTITLPAGAPLNGSVTDDGLPTGAVVTAAWTKFSGPGAVAFANAASAVTTATFGQAGSYVLRLTAGDTLLSAFSDVTITVNPAVVTPPTNLAPVVSAGTAQTITLPAGASLNGSVTDDGLPTGAVVTATWTKFSGPGSVAFANAASAVTTATFDQAGTYVLRLTASDTLLSAFSDVTITVNPAIVTPPTNLAPVVSAGTAQTITLPAGASLNGSVTDDGLPTGAAVTSAWTKFSGPGTVAFANAASVVTTATFGQAGTYVLRLTASDTLLSASSDVTITVNPAIVTPPTNLAPVVSAGTAQTITLPAGASLNGSVTDDGLPTGAVVTAAWTKFSGPGTVAFANAASAVTTATFDQAGSYVLRLTGNDTLLSGFSDVTVTVNPAIVTPPTNLAPVVSAGTAQTITLPAGASLNGSVTDDGLPTGGLVTSAWTKFSGPGTVAFANAASAVTTATFGQAGSYVLRLTASDTLLSAFSDVTVTVNPAIVTPPTNLAPVVSAGTNQTITLPAGASLNGSVTDDGLPTGAAVTSAWTKFSGPGAVAFANAASAATTATFDQAGTYVLRLTASDTLLSAVSDVTITVNPAVVTPPTNHPPTAATDGPRTGETGIAVSFNGAGSTDPDNDLLTYAWTFGDGSTSTDQRPFHVYTAAGAFTVTLTVTDAHSASDVATTSATITAAADRAPPIVVLTGPKEALPGAHVMMSADATDNIGVTSVTLDINGGDPIEITAPPYQRLVIVPDFVAPGASLKVGATARDAAGNIGTASATLAIVAEPDTVKPLVTMKAPSHAAPGSLLQVSATASDNAGVAAVVLAVNGITLATFTAPPYEAPYLIPSGTPVGSSVTFSAQAVDTSDNRAVSSADVSIVQSPDNTPPTVTLSAPATATAGTAITVTATAVDDSGVASVRFFLDGTRVATVADPPYLATLALPATLPNGTRLHVEARALDFSGLEGVASQEVNLVAPAAGVVTGEVYDDASGLPVGGVSVALLGTDARGIPYTQTSESDAHGRYVMAAAEGAGVVRISKPGWSIVNRAIAIKPNKGVAVVDARITAAAAGGAIQALSGGIVSGDRVAFLQVWQREVSAAEDPAIGKPALGGADVLLRIPPGALTSNATVTLTPLSRQSLPGLLPPGWTPLAIVDIGPHGLAFGSGAALTSPNPLNVKAGTPIVFAQWDEPVRAWRAVASTALAQDKGALAGSVEATGQFAWVAADVVPASPPQPAPGELLAGVDAGLIPADASAVVNPQPKILFYKPGVKSDVRGTVTTTGALLPSGTIVRSRITESYQFVTTGEIHPDPMEQDLVLYQIPGGPLPVMAAGFPVSPGLTFEALSLDKGIITVELRAPEEAVHEIDVVGADGGSIAGESGQRLDVKAGSVPASLPIEVRSIPANALGAVLPEGFELVSAASISFVGTLASPAIWSVPSPSGAGDTDTFFLARLQELAGQTRFVLIGIGTLASGRLVSDTTLAGTAVTFEGVRTAGRYVFLRATNPMAFAAGSVTSEGGAGFAGALITSNTAAIVSLSQPTGRYISAIAVGATTISALDLQKTDTVSAPVTASTPRQVIPLDLGLAARPPTVTSVTPADGAVNITLASPIVVTFSSPIDAATATLQNVRLTSSAGVVVGSLALTANNTVATFRALDPLQPNTAYTLTLSQAIADPFGRSLPSPFAATFTSLDTVAPLPPPAGSVTTTIPGADGKTHITATQGTAGSHDTALVKNLTTGKFTPVVLDANGGFTAIVAAVVTDRLQLIITDAAGNKTVVSLPRFRQENSDGTVSEAVGPEGGRLNGPGGIAIDVAEGTFPAGALLKFGPVSETEFPFHLDAAQRLLFQYSGGVRLDFGGTVPTRYVNVSVPTLGGETITDRWLVMQAVQAGGQSSLSAIDTAHVIDGRITTSSPPCPGVTGSGVYGFLKSARPLGVVYGPVTVTDRTLPPGVFIPFLVGPGLIGFPTGFSDLLTPGIDGSFAFQDPLGLGNYISAAGETAAAFSRAPACLPLLSGRASVSQNRFTIATPLSQLTIADREIEVVNVPLARTTRFFRPFQPTMSIEGGNNDAIVVTAIRAGGNRRVLTTTWKARSFVHVLVASTELRTDDREIAIKNLTGTGSFLSGLGASPGLPVLDLHALVEGEASDLYTVEITGAAGVKRNAVFGVLPYAYGNGSLLLRVSPGTIDPTLAEINVFNALVPPAQQLPVAGAVVKVVLQIDDANSSRQEVIADALAGDTARLVGGAVNFAVSGTFDEKYTLHVIYANGNTDEVKIPMFRVNFTNPTTGVVARTITVPVPPPDEPLFLDTSPPTGPTEVVSTPASLVDVDPRTPITVAFSRALDPASVAANLIVFGTDSAGNLVQVAGTWKLSQGSRVAKFIPAGALRLNATYTVALSGVSDLAGQPVAGTSLTVTTFRPRKIGTAALNEAPGGGALPLKDVGFVRQAGPGGEIATYAVAETSNQNGFKVHTIDVTDPRTPLEMGHDAGGSYKRRMTLIPDIKASANINVRYDVQLVPQQTGMSCWAAGAAMVVGWRDRQSVDPKSLIADHDYDTGLFGADTVLFQHWGLVPEPPQTFSVASFRQMLEDYGPLWVAASVPTAHIRVVTGMVGDGTPDGTTLYVNDPWQQTMTSFVPSNKGETYQISYRVFQAQQERLARQWFADAAVYKQFCDSGFAVACRALADPFTVQGMKDCSLGNEAACVSLNLPGGAGVLVAHLPQKPDWVPPLQTGQLTVRLPKPGEAPISTCNAHVLAASGGRQVFSGDLAVTSSWNLGSNYFTFFDVTDASNPCVIGDKTITANPDQLTTFTAPGTFRSQGSARGVTTIHHADGYAAYMAIAEAGLFAVDIGGSIPSVSNPKDRQQEGFYAGDFADVVAVRDRLLAVNNNYGGDASLEVLDPNLSPITSIPLTNGGATKQHRIVFNPGSWVDVNRNGRIDTGEIFDLAFVAGTGGIIVVDVTTVDAPTVAGRIQAPGILREIAVDASGKTIMAGGDRGSVAAPGGGAPVAVAGDALFMIDASNPFATPVVDATGRDSRIVFEYGYPDGIGGMSIDSQRSLVYVGWPASTSPIGALDIWASDRSARVAFNTPPIANAGPDATGDQNQPVTLDGSRSLDPDGDALIYAWTQVSGPPVALSDPTLAKPTFTAPPIDGAVLTFQLIVNDGVVDSPADPVVITVKAKGRLELRPVIAPIAIVPGTKALTVTLTPASGAARDVSADPGTTYRWIGNGLVSGADGLPNVTPILNAIATKLGVPIQIADITVNTAGVLTVNTSGLQVVRAHFKDADGELDSGFSVVLAGIKLKGIALKPESVLTTLGGTLSAAMGTGRNPPMILAAAANGYVLDKGVVLLDDVTFELLGTATIGLKDLVSAIEPLVRDALTPALAETGPAVPVLAHAFTKLAGLGIGSAGVQALDPLVSGDVAIATITDTAPLQGQVQSHLSGLTSITGTLDLGALGKADDSVLVWVLPSVQSVTVEPNLTVIATSDPPSPGPTVRTFVETELIHQAIVPVKGKAVTAAELLDRFLPDGLASWQTTIDKNITTDTPAPGLRFHLRGSAAPNCLPPDTSGNVECSITFSEVGLGFYAPNNARPLINNDYAIGDPTIAALGAVETFDTHLVHQHTLGTSSLTGTVAIALMGGGQDPTARVQVVGSVGGPVQRPVINEVVVEPQRDWNDSGAGGNGVPFDDTPGTSVAPSPAVSAGDQWIELLTVTGSPAELTNWTLEFTSTAGVPIVVTLGPANLTTSAGSPYVLVAAPGAVGVDSIIRLRDTTNAIVDEIDLSAIQAVVGHATGVNDEAVARTPDAFDTGAVTDFTRKPATIRRPNP